MTREPKNESHSKKQGKTGIEEIDRPKAPMGTQILIEVAAASLNRADYGTAPSAKGKIASSGVAGVVQAVGEDVSRFAIGDRVCAVTRGLKDALAAELAIADEKWTAHLPEGISFEQGAALPSAGVTALAGVDKAQRYGNRLFVCELQGVLANTPLRWQRHRGWKFRQPAAP